MKAKLQRLLSNPFVLLMLLMAIVFAVDQVLMQLNVYYAANRPLYNHGLELEAAPNALWYELWFAETIAVVILPFILFWLRDKLRIKARLLPWCVAAIIMVVGVASTGLSIYNDYKDNGYLQREPDYISIIIHQGAFYQPIYDRYDPSLQSMLPFILRGQAAVVGGYIITALGVAWYGAKKAKKQRKS